jgi:hypothetical protein
MRLFTVLAIVVALLAGAAAAQGAGAAGGQDLRAPDQVAPAPVTQDLRAPDRVAPSSPASSAVVTPHDLTLPSSGGGLSTLAIVLIGAGGVVALGAVAYTTRLVVHHGHAAP